jgi:putative acetyltransferase
MFIRQEAPADRAEIGTLHRAAFGGAFEAGLVDRLSDGGLVVVSLVAVDSDAIVGHILFSRLPIQAATGVIHAVALAPMAVVPGRQRQGIGSALVRDGLRACRAQGERIAIVLGHPQFYPRFGFSPDLARPLRSVYSGPAFMALALAPGALDGVEGDVRYPPAFDDSPRGIRL